MVVNICREKNWIHDYTLRTQDELFITAMQFCSTKIKKPVRWDEVVTSSSGASFFYFGLSKKRLIVKPYSGLQWFFLGLLYVYWSKINWHLPLNASGAKLKPIYRDLVKNIFFFCLKQFACFTLSSNWLSLILFILLWFPALISLGFTTLNRKTFYI